MIVIGIGIHAGQSTQFEKGRTRIDEEVNAIPRHPFISREMFLNSGFASPLSDEREALMELMDLLLGEVDGFLVCGGLGVNLTLGQEGQWMIVGAVLRGEDCAIRIR